jgi:hypothetical protein
MVFVDQVPVPGIPSVNVDDAAGEVRSQHLVDLGHRRIGIVNRDHADNPGWWPPRQRRARVASGCWAGPTRWTQLAAADPDPSRCDLRVGGWRGRAAEDADAHAVRELLELLDRPTAAAVLLRRDGLPGGADRRGRGCGCPRTCRWWASTTARCRMRRLSPRAPGREREGRAAPRRRRRSRRPGPGRRRAARSESCCPPSSWSGTAPHRRPAERGAAGVPSRAC